MSPPEAALLMGSSAHETLEVYYKEIMKGEEPLTPGMVSEYSVSVLEENADEVGFTLAGKEKDILTTQLEIATGSYVSHIAPGVVPIAVEEEIKYESRCGVPVLGYLDLVREATDLEKTILGCNTVLADYKFTNKKWSLPQLMNSLQFNLYNIATGISAIEIHNVVKTEKPSKGLKVPSADFKEPTVALDVASNIRVLRHNFAGDENTHFENLIESAAKLITSGLFMPCAPDAWCCTADWCGYYYRCRGKNKPRTPKRVEAEAA